MKRIDMLLAAVILAASSVLAEDAFTFNTDKLIPGSIVRVSARRPPINLGRAEVVNCTSDLLTVRHERETFHILSSNVLQLAVVVAGPGGSRSNAPAAASAKASSDAPAGADTKPGKDAATQVSLAKSLWQKVAGLWK
jgi:hypothetical protein